MTSLYLWKDGGEKFGPALGLTSPAALDEPRGVQDGYFTQHSLKEYKHGYGWQSTQVRLWNTPIAEQRDVPKVKFIVKSQRELREEEMKEEYEAKQALINVEDLIKRRRDQEEAKPLVVWFNIGVDLVTSSYDKVAKGIFYNMEFPWSEKTLSEMGPKWMTRALITSGVMDPENQVTKVITDKSKASDIDAGNNGAKFLFEVRYKYDSPHLPKKLFAKVPYEMGGINQTDRISSSVYKQPMDMKEIDTYRMMEGRFPFRIPRFMYGDISNETSNFILILERLPFVGIKGPDMKPVLVEPGELEGCYEKCKDYLLPAPQELYYSLLMKKAAQLAGFHKAGKMGSEALMESMAMHPPIDNPANFGMNPFGSSGKNIKMFESDMKVARNFIGGTASVLFPDYVKDSEWQDRWTTAMFKIEAYRGEIMFYGHHNYDYVALGHQNLNMDNAFFWRDEDGVLDCGMLDFGGFGSSSLSNKIWWCLNCSEFSNLANLDMYIDIFITEYQASGGPLLEKEELKRMTILCAFLVGIQMAQAIPNCLKQCSTKEWATIENIQDKRISANVQGKSTLRTTLRVLVNVVRAFEEMHWEDTIEDFIHSVFEQEFGCAPKTEAMYLPQA